MSCNQYRFVRTNLLNSHVGLQVGRTPTCCSRLLKQYIWFGGCHCWHVHVHGPSLMTECSFMWPCTLPEISHNLHVMHCPNKMAYVRGVVSTWPAGLFRSVRPACKNGDYSEAPAFLATPRIPDQATPSSSSNKEEDDSSTNVQTVPPLGSIKFIVSERSLPPIKEMSFRLDSALKVRHASYLILACT